MRFKNVINLSTSHAPVLCVLLGMVVSLLYSLHFIPNVLDDSLISYRYSQRLLDGKGLTWNDGEYVEGYSNLLWTLIVALGGLVSHNLIDVGWVLGAVANVATLAAIWWAFGRSPTSCATAVIGGAAVLCLSGAFAFWGVGGLETALFESLMAWAFVLIYRMSQTRFGWIPPGVALGLIALTRTDGVVIGLGLSVALIVRDRISRGAVKRASALLIIPTLATVAQICFRLAYYGSPIPNTAYVKVAFTLGRLWLGIQYVAQGVIAHAVPLVIILGVIAVRIIRGRYSEARTLLAFLFPGVFWLAYIALVGGDLFPYFRQWMPMLISIAFGMAYAIYTFRDLLTWRAAVLLVPSAGVYFVLQHAVSPWSVPLANTPQIHALMSRARTLAVAGEEPLHAGERAIWNCITVGNFLREAFGDRNPLIAVNYAGCMPYASALPALDMLGLTDSYIAHHRPSDMGMGFPAHELGDGPYVLSRKPDLVAFCIPATGSLEPCFRGEVEMARLPDFRQKYRPLFFRSHGVEAVLWARIEDGRLGITRTPDSVFIPGFLLASSPEVPAVLDSSGRLVVELEGGVAAVVNNVYIPPGSWEVVGTSSGDGLTLTASSDGGVVKGQRTIRVHSHGTQWSFWLSGSRGSIYSLSLKKMGSS